MGGRIFIGVPSKGMEDWEVPAKELAILHVTRVEELAARKAGKERKAVMPLTPLGLGGRLPGVTTRTILPS
jgi:hypothetical protein